MNFFLGFMVFPTSSRTIKEKAIIAGLILLISGWISYTIFSISLKSQWAVNDDREIAYFLGGDKKINISEAWVIYTQDTEIGKYGLYGRFRPSYNAFRLLESVIWNDELTFWYLTNILIFSLFIAVFWYLSAEFIGLVLAGLISFYVATSLYWRDVFGRLGPSEPYVVLGMCIASLGIYILYRFKMNGFGWLFLSFGLMICTGAKENTFLFLLLYGLILVDQYRRRNLNMLSWFFLILTAIWNGWIISSILIYLVNNGKDVYQSSILDKILTVLTVFNRSDVIILCLVSIFFFVAFLISRKYLLKLSNSALFLTKVAVFLLVFYISQCIFYTGDFPNDDRYDVPGLLVMPIALILIIFFTLLVVREQKNKRYEYLFLALLIVVGTAIDLKRINNIRIVRNEIGKYLRYEKEFTRDVEKLAALVGTYENYAIIFQVSRPMDDYQIILPYNQFLRYYGVDNPIAIYWSGDDVPSTDSHLYPFFDELVTISRGGAEALPNAHLPGDFVPLPSLEASYGKKCILVLFSHIAPGKDCPIIFEVSGDIWSN